MIAVLGFEKRFKEATSPYSTLYPIGFEKRFKTQFDVACSTLDTFNTELLALFNTPLECVWVVLLKSIHYAK